MGHWPPQKPRERTTRPPTLPAGKPSSPVRVTGLQRRDTDGYVRRDNRKQIRPPAGTGIPIEGLTDQEEHTFPMDASQSNARLRADAGTPTSGVIHVRTRLTSDFTVIANALVQRRGSAVTIGVAAYISSLPDGSPVSIAALCEHFSEGEILISRALRELEAAGYLERRRERLPTGQVRTRTYFYDIPGGHVDPDPDPNGPDEPPKPSRPRERPATETTHTSAPLPSQTETEVPDPAHRRRPASLRRTHLPAPGRPTPRPLRAGGRTTRTSRRPVARGRRRSTPDHRIPHHTAPRPLSRPPGRHPRLPPARDSPARPATGGAPCGPPGCPALPDLRRLRTGIPRSGTRTLPGMPIRKPSPCGRVTTSPPARG